MNNLKIKYLAAENFLCFGAEGIELDLTRYGNIILVRGENCDVKSASEEDRIASNGVGKSSIPEILVYTLFGKTIKNPKKLSHGDVINNQIGKKLKTEVHLDNLKIIRCRKPDSLRVWEWTDNDWNEISLGGMPATQKLIEDRLGLTYETFVNLVVFTDNNAGSFLECDTPTKREIVENLLSLDRYRVLFETSKKMKNKGKEDIKDSGRELELALTEYEASKRRITKIQEQESEWKKTKEAELVALVGRIKAKQLELQNTDKGAALAKYDEAQEKIAALTASLPGKDEKLTLIKTALEDARKKQEETRGLKDTANLTLNQVKMALDTAKNTIKEQNSYIANQEAQRCQYCGKIDENGVTRARGVIEVQEKKFEELNTQLVKEQASATRYTETLAKLVEVIKLGDGKSREVTREIDAVRQEIAVLARIEKPEISANEKIIEDHVLELKSQALAKKKELAGDSPYVEIMRSAVDESEVKNQECEAKKAQLNELNKKLPYYEFWVDAFGDTGIRKFIIDGIIPALNSRVAYWLQFLIDGKIKLAFDNELEETIERNPSDGDPFVYHAMSGGERRRLNLAVSQAFAHIMMLNSGTCPSISFLDEVTTNVDPVGVQGVYNMIVELAKEKQVFVTTHDHDLLDLLNGCEAINLRKENGFTTLVSS